MNKKYKLFRGLNKRQDYCAFEGIGKRFWPISWMCLIIKNSFLFIKPHLEKNVSVELQKYWRVQKPKVGFYRSQI
jgi:hypothetical protein